MSLDITKINVRSPFYITVGKDEEAETAPVAVVIPELALDCGETRSVGASSGTKRYVIDVSDRVLGDITVSLTGVKTPIRYRLGQPDDMPNFATVGLDSYLTQWENATGETTGLASAAGNPNGASVNAVYDYTQSDKDTYGSILRLEIQQPIQTEDYTIALTCTAIANDEAADTAGFVTMVSISNYGGSDRGTFTLNGTTLPSALRNVTGVSTEVSRFVMSDISPNIEPEGGIADLFNVPNRFMFNNEQANKVQDITFRYVGGGYSNLVTYMPENILGSGVNVLKYIQEDPVTSPNQLFFKVVISRHPVEFVNGVNVIRGNGDLIDFNAIEFTHNFGFAGPGGVRNQDAVLEFNGSNTTELALVTGFLANTEDGSKVGDLTVVEKVYRRIY